MPSNIGTRLRRLRKHRGLKQNELAKKCFMEPAVICRIESRETLNPSLYHLRRLAKVLEVTIDELVIGPLNIEKEVAP